MELKKKYNKIKKKQKNFWYHQYKNLFLHINTLSK